MINRRYKGARDLLPDDTERFRHIQNAFVDSCLKWGYKEVKTSTLEYLHLFTAAGTLTPSMLNKVYSFLDWDGWSGERVVLRPDGTIPVARLYVENLSDKSTAKLFYLTNVFSYEETGKESRERWQCGTELIGDAKPASDVEILILAIEVLRKLDIPAITVQLSHAGVLKALIKNLYLGSEKETELLNQIREGNWKNLSRIKTNNPDSDRLVSLLVGLKGKSSGYLKNIKALPGISRDLNEALDNFIEITDLLDAMSYDYQIDITSTRRFEYYTGLCFQFSTSREKIGGGGRYDGLVPLIGGHNTPACGFALYMDPLMKLVKTRTGENEEQGVLIHGMADTKDMVKSCFVLAQSLRDLGYISELSFNDVARNWRWTVYVQQPDTLFIIHDKKMSSDREAKSIREVINIIGGSV
jgi:histidyl-tRNA synthetase